MKSFVVKRNNKYLSIYGTWTTDINKAWVFHVPYICNEGEEMVEVRIKEIDRQPLSTIRHFIPKPSYGPLPFGGGYSL